MWTTNPKFWNILGLVATAQMWIAWFQNKDTGVIPAQVLICFACAAILEKLAKREACEEENET